MADSEGAVAPAEPASETPPPATLRIGRFAVASGLVISAVVHFLLIAPAVILTSRLLQSEPAQSVTVDLITPQELAAISDKAAPPEQPPQPPPATPAQPEPPVSEVASANPFATPLLPPPAPDPALQAPLLTTLAGLSPSPEKDGGASEYQANLTADEIKAFATHVQSCWAAPPGLAKDVYVIVRVSLRRDGSLMAEPSLQGGSASKAAMALTVANSAKSALHKCTPYGGLPVAKYDEWRVLDLRFTPNGISTASTVSGTARSG